MIQKFVFGTPFETEAVIENIPVSDKTPVCGTISLKCETTQNTGSEFIFSYQMSPQDAVYGLGEANRGINKRGYRYISNCTDDPNHTENKTSLYGAHNFILISGEQTFGLFFDYPSTMTFDIGYTRQDTLTVTCEEANLALYYIESDTADRKEANIVKQFRHMIGRSYIPPKFAFGYGQSRWGYRTQEDFRNVVRGYRKNHIPLDMLYMDIDYMQDYKDFTINESEFSDFQAFVDDMKADHIHLVPIIDAGVKIEDGYDIYEEGCEKGYFCKRADGSNFAATVWPGRTHFPDVLNPEARAWFGSKYEVLTSYGIEGFWNDMNEPAIFSSDEETAELKEMIRAYADRINRTNSPNSPCHHSPADDKDADNTKSLSLNITNGATINEEDDTSIDDTNNTAIADTDDASVSGTNGVSFVQSDGVSLSDIQSKLNALSNNPEDYRRFYHNVNGRMIRHDKVHNLFGYNMTRAASEGLEQIAPGKRFLLFSRSSYIGMHRYGGIWTGDNQAWWSHLLLNIKMMPSLNMCGFLYAGADLGGFGSDTTRDLLLRWLAFGVFTPLMRNHAALGTRDQECYRFENPQDFSHVIGVRYRLLPYIYSEYMKATLNDDMYFKPLAFDYPENRRARETEDQLMIGNEIMIAPVYTQNATGRYVYLPEEMKFIKFIPDGTISEETLPQGDHYVDIALNEVPLFIRKGKCIPVVDFAENVDQIDMHTLQYIGYADAEYELYEDDGVSKIE